VFVGSRLGDSQLVKVRRYIPSGFFFVALTVSSSNVSCVLCLSQFLQFIHMSTIQLSTWLI
jgi:hypothetical protein